MGLLENIRVLIVGFYSSSLYHCASSELFHNHIFPLFNILVPHIIFSIGRFLMTIDYHHHLTVLPLLTNIYNAPNLNIISLRKLLRQEIVDSMGRNTS